MQSPQGPVVSRGHFCHSPASTLLGLHTKGVPPAPPAVSTMAALPPAVRGGGQQESSIPAVAGPWRSGSSHTQAWGQPWPLFTSQCPGFLFVLQTHQGSLVSGTRPGCCI